MPSFGQTIASLYRQNEDGQLRYLGTAFAFRREGAFLTASHCINGLEPREVVLASPRLAGGGPTPILSIARHDTADVAVVKVAGTQHHLLDPFYMVSTQHQHQAGAAVGAWGYPEDSSPTGGMTPTPRVFKGTVQRTLQHQSHLGYEYHAGELSFGAPRGLSGGPVFTLPQEMHLAGVVTENLLSTTELHAVEEYEEDGAVTRERIQRVIQYGLFVDLAPLTRWLDQEAGGELG